MTNNEVYEPVLENSENIMSDDEFKKLILESLNGAVYEEFENVLEKYVCDPDIHKVAYSINTEYKLFYDKLPENIKQESEKVRRRLTPLAVVKKVDHARLHLATFGVSALFIKSPKKIVKSEEFTVKFRLLNVMMDNY